MTEMKKPKTQQEKNTTKKLPNQLTKDISNAEVIINAIGDGISILDRNFKILYENQAHRNMMGIHVGDFCYEAYSKRQGICSECPVALTFKDGKAHTVEREKQTENETKHMQITSSPLKNSEGKIIAGIRVVRDITERKRAGEALLKKEKELILRVKELEDFYGMAVGRELRMKQLKEEIEKLKEQLEKYEKSQ